MSSLITLTTDFGRLDGYVAAMKGVILGINPQAAIVDVSHEVAPQDIAGAAFLLCTVAPYFPVGAIHVVVVDPGVGTERRAIAVSTPTALFVAPDNGVLSYVLRLPHWGAAVPGAPHPSAAVSAPVEEEAAPFPGGIKAVRLTNSAYWRHPVSATFHGRDIFAAIAAHLSRGVPIEEMGEPISSLVTFPIPKPERLPDGSLLGEVIYIDHFGNLITDIRESDLPRGELVIEVAGRQIRGLSVSYAQGDDFLALVGSSGRLEIARRNGSAAEMLGIGVGGRVKVRML
ncbi:MAG: SAM-dependent chlorinase/fluorinase [Chloroflexi bacterium]|nr:SAM-dependent chlorinase/fluorinase [Chloroflexota bacterium]